MILYVTKITCVICLSLNLKFIFHYYSLSFDLILIIIWIFNFDTIETPPPGYMSEDGDNHDQNGTDNMGNEFEKYLFKPLFVLSLTDNL